MLFAIGTQNKGKIKAVKQALEKYQDFKRAEVISCEVETGVNEQPIGLDEIITGAKNRAKAAYQKNKVDFGIGLESGIFKVPHTKSNYMDVTGCAIYDGQHFHIGLSSCFEYPKKLIDKIVNENKDVSDAAIELGFFKNRSVREAGGMVGILTQGVITRIKYSEQAVHTAIIHLLNKDYY